MESNAGSSTRSKVLERKGGTGLPCKASSGRGTPENLSPASPKVPVTTVGTVTVSSSSSKDSNSIKVWEGIIDKGKSSEGEGKAQVVGGMFENPASVDGNGIDRGVEAISADWFPGGTGRGGE